MPVSGTATPASSVTSGIIILDLVILILSGVSGDPEG